MKLTVLIPAHNEEGSLAVTVNHIAAELIREDIDHEILVVNDNSSDGTEALLQDLCGGIESLRYINNRGARGIGRAIQAGLQDFHGDAVAIVMADGSDSPGDISRYFRGLESGYECVFGSRFIKGSHVQNYPRHKLILNRLANHLIKLLFRLHYNDITNAFKCYRREVIQGIQPILSHHFNITVELPLKAIVRGYSYTVIPISWKNRVAGKSKLRIKEMGSRYLFMILYVLLEKLLSRGDYRRRDRPTASSGEPASLLKNSGPR